MTYLETLVRILPRRARVLRSKKSSGAGMALVGYGLASIAVLLLSTTLGHTFGAGLILIALIGGYLMLGGGYRYVSSDMLLARTEEEILAVTDALEEQYAAEASARGGLGETFEQRVHIVLTGNTLDFIKALEAELDRLPAKAARHG